MINLPSAGRPTTAQPKKKKEKEEEDKFLSHFSSFLTVYLLFCGLTKRISPKICMLSCHNK